VHDRAFSGPDVSAVQCSCTVETRDKAHIRELFAALRKAGFQVAPDRTAGF
jgi:threonine dehydratase